MQAISSVAQTASDYNSHNQQSLGEGPFYPDKMPLDTDNDLLVLNEGITPAVGEIAYVSGRVLTKSGEPLRNGYVEIWQTESNGSYLHSGGRNTGGYDSNFQGKPLASEPRQPSQMRKKARK